MQLKNVLYDIQAPRAIQIVFIGVRFLPNFLSITIKLAV